MKTYIDSSIVLRSILDKESSANRILDKLRGSAYKVIIPHLVMGEAFSAIFSKSKQEELNYNLKSLCDWIMKLVPDPSTQMPAANEESYKFAIDLKDHDNRIDACDALLVSQALLDEASLLLTFDKKIQNSNYIEQKIEERGSKIRILERL